MPLYREWNSDVFSLAAIWEIAEPEEFFVRHTGIVTDIKSHKRRLEHLAGRFLLRHLQADFPLQDIFPDAHDKPRISGNPFFFSISHSYPYVAAVVSRHVECGIDIQTWHQRMPQLQDKFLSPAEQELFRNDPKLLTLAWCAKEAAYKWQGRRGVAFIDHLPIHHYRQTDEEHNINVILQLTNPKLEIKAKAFTGAHFACALITNDQEFHPTF